MDPVSQEFVTLLDEQINILCQERDRVILLMDSTLPKAITVWSILPKEIREMVKSNIRENLKGAADRLQIILAKFDELPTSASAVDL